MQVQMRFHGGREMAAGLRRLPRIVAQDILETAVVAGAGIVRQAAEMKAPRPAERRRPESVRLADSIRVWVTSRNYASVTVQVGTRIPYGHLVEYGHQIVPRGPTRERFSITTVRISRKTGRQRVSTRWGVDPSAKRRTAAAKGFVAARPFLRPALDENREAVLRRQAEVIRKGIEVESRRMAMRTAQRAA